MSLYEGIDVGREISQEENKEKKGFPFYIYILVSIWEFFWYVGWDTGLKLLQSHIQLKKASLTTVKSF